MGEEDKKIIFFVLSAYQWLHNQLGTAKVSIRRLKNIFGFSTEKRSALGRRKNNGVPLAENAEKDNNSAVEDSTQKSEGPPVKKY
jgi:hypothetical protein